MQLNLRTRKLSGLGQWEALAASFLTSQAKGAATPGATNPQQPGTSVTTSTAVNTQVSPQISPVMVQQQQPQNSAVNASPAMFSSPMPGQGSPVTGAFPGFDNASGFAPTGVPMALPSARASIPILGAVVVALGAALYLGRRKKK